MLAVLLAIKYQMKRYINSSDFEASNSLGNFLILSLYCSSTSIEVKQIPITPTKDKTQAFPKPSL